MTIDNIIDNFLLSGDKFMPKIYLKQPRRAASIPGFTYSAYGWFIKKKY